MLTIGKLGEATGVKIPTIRYYEQIGLLPEAERSRTTSGSTGSKAFERLYFIRHAASWSFR